MYLETWQFLSDRIFFFKSLLIINVSDTISNCFSIILDALQKPGQHRATACWDVVCTPFQFGTQRRSTCSLN